MKIVRRVSLSFLGAICIFAAATAQAAPPQETAPAAPLQTLKRDLRNAADLMAPCMPIYEGHCGQAKTAVHEARVIVDAAIAAANPPVAEKPKATDEPHKKPAEKALSADKPVAKEPTAKPAVAKEIPPAPKPETKEEQDEKIKLSQTNLRKGLEAIQQASKDLKAAGSALPQDQAGKLEKLLQTAEAEATKAISLHAAQG